MNRKGLLKHLIFLMFFIFIAHLIATKLYWYYSIWWFDMPQHFLGGLWEGLFFAYVLWWKKALVPNISLFIKIILFVLVIGILWEFFEFYANNYIGHDPFNILDTASDLFFDLSGAVLAVLYVAKRIMMIPESTVQ